jgi:hypothetical protein
MPEKAINVTRRDRMRYDIRKIVGTTPSSKHMERQKIGLSSHENRD